ncbi:FliI/YscN family ATPase [Thalassobius sp. MITS945101]|uniref:FliI/YscN family ATPase n=1 Tax=Thalassobius sp. MITS945101 TaxID=3096994 RepID=UPI00399B49C8
MQMPTIPDLTDRIAEIAHQHPLGWVNGIEKGLISIKDLEGRAALGDRVKLHLKTSRSVWGDVVRLRENCIEILPDGSCDGLSLGDSATLHPPLTLGPCAQWIGRIIDSTGAPLDGRSLVHGVPRALAAPPPAPAQRRGFGSRLRSGMTCFNTLLPIVRGQRIGLFAGSGVGKSMLLAQFARALEAEVIVLALIGERGRELRDFVENTLGPDGMKRTVILAETSDRPALARRRCAAAAVTVAEYFRDQGKQVLLLMDSVTRLAEAHREVALSTGETAGFHGFPPSTPHLITALCERTGTGVVGQGDITAVFSVLVAGSDMEGPVADILRGVLDGHVVLDREIAERGRYPAIDLLRSVSRALTLAATEEENQTIARARQLLGLYDSSAMMIRAGLYATGSDPELDRAIAAWPELDRFLAQEESGDITDSFNRLRLILKRADRAVPQSAP